MSRRFNLPAPGTREGWGWPRYIPLMLLMVAVVAATIVGLVVKL